MSADRHNLFTTSDAAVIAEIMAKIETYRSVMVFADRDADVIVGPEKWPAIAKRRAAHPEQFIGNYSARSDPLDIEGDLIERKLELLKYGRAQRELHPHLKWAR